jgi:hypothetical protein
MQNNAKSKAPAPKKATAKKPAAKPATKKSAPKTPAVELSITERYYIQQHVHTKTVEQVAQDIGKSVRDIASFYDAERKQAALKGRDRFERPAKGTVVMTQAQSKLADDMAKAGQLGNNEEYLKEMSSVMFIIDPSQPIT